MTNPLRKPVRRRYAIAGAVSFLLLASCAKTDSDVSSKYLPSIRDDDCYRFSEMQLKHMAETPLDRNSFLRYLETKWPLDRLRSHCTPQNRSPDGEQNLVCEHNVFGDIVVHETMKHEFDKIYVYVNDDDGRSNYFGEAGTKWNRWEYSLNIFRGHDHWVIIECLPNDFVDNLAKYVPPPAPPTNRAK